MSHDALEDRRKALEEQFFKDHNDALVKKLKDEADKQHSREELQKLTGIGNDQVLDALAALKLGGAATLVMSLYPIIAVAWADGKIDPKERQVILDLSATIGLKAGTDAHGYLTKWLDEKPELHWHELWTDYVKALVEKMKADDKALLKATVLGRARVVAETSGGFLGLAWRVSDAEQRTLDKLEAAFG